MASHDPVCRLVFRALGVCFSVTGLAFLLAPDGVVRAINRAGELFGSFPEAPVCDLRFYVSLTFAYMVLVAILAFMAGHDPIRYMHAMPMLIAGKLASSITGLAFYFTHQAAFIYLVTFLCDGAIVLLVCACWIRTRRVSGAAA